MLIYVPSQYAQDSEDLNSESRALQKLEQSCTWKTKSRQPRFWLKELKKGTLTMLLSGLTLEPSEEKNFMARWTSSLGDSLANPSQLQARDSEMTIQETSGMKSRGLQESSDTQLSFLKMSKTSHDTTTIQSEKTYKKWVTQLRKDYSLREKSAYHTVGNDYSCLHVSQTQTISNPTYYPTPTTQEIAHNDMSLTSTGRRQTKDKRDSHSLNLQDKVRLWRTASASDGKGGNEDYKRKELDGKNPRIKLSQQATYRGVNGQPSKNWPDCSVQGLQGPEHNQSETRQTPGCGYTLRFAPPTIDDDIGWAHTLAHMPEIEPSFCRVVNGLPIGMEQRLRTLGNAVVPAMAAKGFTELVKKLQTSK